MWAGWSGKRACRCWWTPRRRSSSIYPNVKFVVAGGGDFRFDLADRARRNGVGDWFIFPGRISDEDRDRLYKVADVAVFPSLYEPFGIVALEAMAAGSPVVVSDGAG